MKRDLIETGDFFTNVTTALSSNPAKALRLDTLADLIEPATLDGSHRWRVLDKLKAAETFESQGLGSLQFELIPSREQEGYGFPQEEFPRVEMGERPGTKKRRPRANGDDLEGDTTPPKSARTYWPIVAIKDPTRARMKADLAEIAELTSRLIQEKYQGRYDVVLSGKSFQVKFAGFSEEES